VGLAKDLDELLVDTWASASVWAWANSSVKRILWVQVKAKTMVKDSV